MKKKLSVLAFALVLAFATGCSSKDGQAEFIEKNNAVVDINNGLINNAKDSDEFREKIKEMEDAIQAVDDLDMSEENEKITEELVEKYKGMAECLTIMSKNTNHNKQKQINEYNKQINTYNKLQSEANKLARDVK